MEDKNMSELTKYELYNLARKYDIKERTKMSEEELIQALKKVIINEEQTEIEDEKFDLGEQIKPTGSSEGLTSETGKSQGETEVEQQIERKKSIYFDGDPLPDGYGDNKIVLMPKNAQWLYAYWEIDENKVGEIRKNETGNLNPAIRIYDVTLKDFDGNNANNYRDIEIPDMGINDWFIGDLNPKATYVADIGYKKEDGSFITVARSNSSATSSESISDNVDTKWMIIEEYFKKILARSSAGRIKDGKWVGGKGASGAILGSSEEMVSVLLKRLIKDKKLKKGKMLSQLERELGSLGISSLGASSLGASGGSLSVGSFSIQNDKGEVEKSQGELGKGNVEKNRDFYLKVGTELILYGETEPDADVTVMGEKIELNPDGTFSFRYALPNGHYELPVIAISNDGEEARKITPIVDRNEE
ncbi:MAG: DUF4912 domain-containing protein [Fusobacteriota bacterium]